MVLYYTAQSFEDKSAKKLFFFQIKIMCVFFLKNANLPLTYSGTLEHFSRYYKYIVCLYKIQIDIRTDTTTCLIKSLGVSFYSVPLVENLRKFELRSLLELHIPARIYPTWVKHTTHFREYRMLVAQRWSSYISCSEVNNKWVWQQWALLFEYLVQTKAIDVCWLISA